MHMILSGVFRRAIALLLILSLIGDHLTAAYAPASPQAPAAVLTSSLFEAQALSHAAEFVQPAHLLGGAVQTFSHITAKFKAITQLSPRVARRWRGRAVWGLKALITAPAGLALGAGGFGAYIPPFPNDDRAASTGA